MFTFLQAIRSVLPGSADPAVPVSSLRPGGALMGGAIRSHHMLNPFFFLTTGPRSAMDRCVLSRQRQLNRPPQGRDIEPTQLQGVNQKFCFLTF